MNWTTPLLDWHIGHYELLFTWLTIFGLMGNLLFTGRVLVQWIASERAGRTVVPVAFWWVSIAATLIQLVYALARRDKAGLPNADLPMFLGLSVTILPYLRNLRLHYRPDRPPRSGAQIMIPAALLMLLVVLGMWRFLPRGAWWIFALGLAGQAVYCSRFIVAWVRSESQRKAVLPLSFWYLSVAGSLTLLLYSFLRRDPVFILGFLFNSIPAIRNMMLIYRERAAPPLRLADPEA